MKKSLLLCLSVFILLIAFTSCDNSWMYKSANADFVEAVKPKTTIKTFEHLKEPLVVSFPVYETFYFVGDQNNDVRAEREGDVIAVIDIETDSVYDWIFFPGHREVSLYFERLVETGSNPTRYLMSTMQPASVAILDPQKNTLAVTEIGIRIDDNIRGYKLYGTKVPFHYEKHDEKSGELYNYIRLFDISTNKMSYKDIIVSTPESDCYIGSDYFRSDSEGNLWISYHSYQNEYISKIDTNSEKLESPFVTFESHNARSKSFNNDSGEFFAIKYVSDDYLFAGCYPKGFVSYGVWVYVVNLQTGEKIEIALDVDNDHKYIENVFMVNDSYYAVVPYTGYAKNSKGINIYKINLDTKSAEKEVFIPFEMTEKSFVRGDRIYFMNSINTSELSYTCYDTVTKQQGKVVRFSAEQIINTKAGK